MGAGWCHLVVVSGQAVERIFESWGHIAWARKWLKLFFRHHGFQWLWWGP